MKSMFYGSCYLGLEYKSKKHELANKIYKILTETGCDDKIDDLYSSNIHHDVDGNPKNGWEHVSAIANKREKKLSLSITEFEGNYPKGTKSIICGMEDGIIESDYRDKTTRNILKTVLEKIREKEGLK